MWPRSLCLQLIVVSCLALALPRFGRGAGAQSLSDPLLKPTRTPATQHTPATTVGPPAHHNGIAGRPQLSTSHPLVLLVDGRLSPERIPDQVAYRHFISVTALSSGASAAETRRRDAILNAVGLSSADCRNYTRALATVGDALRAIEQDMQAAQADVSALDVLKQQKGHVMDSAATRAVSSLSAGGAALLRKHLNDRVKGRIRIYGQAQ